MALTQAGIKTHSVTSRVKDRASFLEKVERKGYMDPFSESPDLVGARVVCLFIEDLPALKRLADQWFEILEEEDKVEESAPDTFGYMSHHYVCRLKQEHTGPRYDQIKNIRFELQCRTILQDAWANVSHYLAYKGESSIPDELRRDFYALSGLFYVADRHFQLFFSASQASDEAGLAEVQNSSAASKDLDLNRPRLKALLAEIYPDRRESGPASVSELVEELEGAGYDTVEKVRSLLETTKSVFEAYESQYPPGSSVNPDPTEKFLNVGAARISLYIKDPRVASDRNSTRVDIYERYHEMLAKPQSAE
jgi:putative GTP pyrophosphokinase